MESLTATEQSRLKELEQEILGGMHATGFALMEIRDSKLYRATHNTFEEYCEATFGIGKAYAYRQIEFAKVKLSPIGDEIQNEGQARAISSVPEEKRREVVEAVKSSGKPVTAAAIAEASKPSTEKVANWRQKQKEENPTFRDKTGYAVPDEWVPLFNRETEVSELRRKISEVRVSLRKASENGDILWAPVSISIVLSELDAVYAALDDAIPFAVCCFCQGVTFKQCRVCKGRGVISRRIYNDTVPAELKAVRDQSCVK